MNDQSRPPDSAPSPPNNEHLQNLGFELTETVSTEAVQRLLEACQLDVLPEADRDDWARARYYCAETRAGGIAGCVGWNRGEDAVVFHSLAVAPSSRRNGIGASLLATALGHVMETNPVGSVYLRTRRAIGYFSQFGFTEAGDDAIPDAVARHPVHSVGEPGATTMVKQYRDGPQRGLDQCAFRLVDNSTTEDLLPSGSVFFFEQSGAGVEANYRGSPVECGHVIGSIEETRLRFLWHQYTESGELMQGEGRMRVHEREDGRRELRETLGGEPAQMLLREV